MVAIDFSTIRERVVRCVSARREIQAAYLFGSVVSGRARHNSDVDVAVLIKPANVRSGFLKYRLKLMADLAGALGRADVDLIVLNEAPPVLAHQVLAKGKLVFERSASARIEFHVRTVNLYFDTEPMRKIYRHYLKKRIREGNIFG